MTEPSEEDDDISVGVGQLTFVAGVVVLGYLGGVMCTDFKVFPYPQLLKPSFKKMGLLSKWRLVEGMPSRPYAWSPTPPTKRSGVYRRDPSNTVPGYTLHTSADRPHARLIDTEGQVLHQWRQPFREVWSDPPHIDEPNLNWGIYWEDVHLLADGSLLAIYASSGELPWGYGMVKLDLNSEVLWEYAGRTHDDFDVADDGTIYTLTHRLQPFDSGHSRSHPDAVLGDFIVRLSSDGRELQRVSLLEMLDQSPYWGLLEMFPTYIEAPKEKKWDILHANSLEIVGSDFAEHHEFAEADDLLVSFRSADTIAVIDMDREEVVWGTRGFWWQPSDAAALDNGHVMVFDAGGHGGPEKDSRIVEIAPDTNAVTWSYAGTVEEPFWSVGAGTFQPLPGGNVLINSATSGRIFEVTREERIVWEYVNPVLRENNGQTYAAITTVAKRIDPDGLTFLTP